MNSVCLVIVYDIIGLHYNQKGHKAAQFETLDMQQHLTIDHMQKGDNF